MFTNFLLCCCHAYCCFKDIITNFNGAIVVSIGIVSLFAFFAVLLYYFYRKEELNAYTKYRTKVTGKDSTATSQTSNK